MGCSNARLLVQTPLSETNTATTLNANNPLNPLTVTTNETSPIGVSPDTNNSSTRMHLTGVDLVVERNGSYTLLLTPKTHKQLMPYVLRKKRFRILVDKPRLEGTSTVNPPLTSYDLPVPERIMESGKELKLTGKKGKKQNKQKMESTIESVQQAASDELDKAKARFVGGRSIDRGNPEDIDDTIQSDDEGMIEEIVTTVEEDKDLECKVKKKIETKKTVAQDPETHNKITKVVKTEVTEITRTITINDQHDLERAKRELGIDDVNKLLPSTQIIYNVPSSYHSTSSWIDHPRLTHVQEKYYEPSNEIVTSGDFPSDSPIKQHSPTNQILEHETKQDQPLADATTVGRGPVVETISSSSISPLPPSTTTTTNEQKSTETQKKKKKSSLNLCSCTRSTTNDYDEEQRKQKAATIIEQKSKQKKKASVTTTNAVLTSTNLQTEAPIQIQGKELISNDIKQLILDKKSLLIDYIHSKIFVPSKLFTTNEQDSKGKKISSRSLDLLRDDRCSSWTNLFDQLKNEYSDQLPANLFIQPMVKTYEDLFTNKQSNFLNTFSTIHNEKDLKNIPENNDYITIVQTYINQRDNQQNIGVITKPFVENIEDTLQRLQDHAPSDKKVIDDDHEKQQALVHSKEIDMADDINKNLPIYNEEQLTKALTDISPHKPITLAEAIAYQYIDLEDPKLGLSNDIIQRIKNLFRPLTLDDESALNLIRIKRAGQYLADFNLAETNSFERFHLSEPFIYQLQQSFEPTLDFNEKQFRSLTDTILNNKDEYSKLQFDIGRTLLPVGDMKESSTNDFSQSDSGYSMTTATYESLANKVRNEFETINEPISDQLSESDKTVGQSKLSDDTHLDETTHSNEKKLETVQQTTENLDKNKDSIQVSSEPILTKEEQPTTTKPVHIKKRKSAGLFSCFRNKKAKASTEQRGPPTLTPPSVAATTVHTTNSIQEKPTIDYAILPDGKRIYIDTFRDRPGLDMSYKPNDFDTRFVLPVTKPAEEYERSITPENTELQSSTIETVEEQSIVHLEPRAPTIEPVDVQAEVVEEKPHVHLVPRAPTIEPVDVQVEVVEEKPHVHLVPRAPTIEPVDVQPEIIEHKTITHLEPRAPTIEPVDVQLESKPIVIPSTKSEESTVTKTVVTLGSLHGAPVDLPEIELVEPGPLPTLSITKEKHKKPKELITKEKTPKVKKSTVGLCASCFGAKAAEKKKKETTSETVNAPIEQKKVIEEEKKDDVPPTTIITTTTPTIESSPLPILSSTTDDRTILPDVNIDTFTERTSQKSIENLPHPEDRLGGTIENLLTTEEPHYQLPSSEPVPPIIIENEYSLPESNTYDVPRTIETPSVENIQINTEEKVLNNEIITPPEIIEIQKSSDDIVPTEQKLQSTIVIETETMPNVEVKESTTKASFSLLSKKAKTKKVKEPKVKEPKVKEPKVKEPKVKEPKVKEPKVKEPKVKEPKVKEPKVKEPKVKEPKVEEPKVKTEKTPGFISTLFCHSNRKSKAPALDLPSVERDLSPNNELREPHRHESDPLRIPHTDLPKPDLSLPTYDRPEVNMASGQTKQTSEFSIPVVDLPPIPDLQLPENDKQPIDLNIDHKKVPNVNLPELQFTSNEQEQVQIPEVPLITDIKQEKDVEYSPTIETGLALASPLNDTLDIQIDRKDFPVETDYEIKTDLTIPDLPKLPSDETEINIKPELLSTEQKYTITDTYFVQPPELPIIVEKQTIENLESPPKLPDFTFELPSTEPISILSKDITVSPPSFDDDVPSIPSIIVPAIDISSPPIKSIEKEVIEPKSDIKKKSSTVPLCSCFGNKSNAQKEKTKTITAPKEKSKKIATPKEKSKTIAATKEKSKTIAAPKADLPEIDMPVPSSNISSTLKTKGSLRAPSNDLPPVDLTLPPSEPVRLPAIIHTLEKKRQAPKKPAVKEEKVSPQTTTSPEAVVPVTTTVNEVEIQQTNIVPSIEVKEEPLVQSPFIEKQVEEEINIRPPTPPSVLIEKQVEEQLNIQTPTPPQVEEIKVESTINSTTAIEKQSTEVVKETPIESKKSSSFEIKAPALNIPELNLSGPVKSDGYTSSLKHDESIITTTTQSRSDSGLEAILSSHLHPSSTFGTNQTIEDLNQHQSISSGLGSEIIDTTTTTTTTKVSTLANIQREKYTTEPKRENSILKHDFTRKISMNDELRTKLIFRQNELKKCLEVEISKSIEDFDPKKDQKSLDKILTHGIDLIKDKKVTTYPELKKKLIIEHKNDAFIVDPVVRSLYCTIEKQGLDNIDKPEFPLAIRDMVRLPAKQTLDTVTHLNKEITEEPSSKSHEPTSTSSCLTCGRTKSKPKIPSTPITNTGLLDERRRVQLNTHRNELGTILRDHIQSSQPPIRQFAEHPREVEKILRKSLTLVTQPKILSYEQIRNDLKTEYKQTFYLIDPTIDIIRDTFDHCDITQMNEKTNLNILDSNISQTANLYNQINNQTNLLTTEELNLLKSNQLIWLNQYLIDNELKEKKITRKQNKELNKILNRTLELISLNLIYTWDELNSQLRREFSKAHSLCDRSIELIKQAQKDGLLLLQQSPNNLQQDVTTINIINVNGKRRASSLITDRARQNLKNNRKKIISSITTLLFEYNKPLYTENQIETYVNKTFHYLEEQKSGRFQTYNDLKDKLKKDFKHNHEKLIEQIVDIIEQVHATNQFDDLDKPEVQTLMRDRLDGKPLVIKEMYVSLPPRVGAYGTSKHDESSRYLSTTTNGDQTLNSSTSSHRVGRGLSWREANERARILFYRGKHPAIHYDEQAAAFDVRMLLETTAGGTQEIPVTDSDVHELLNSCGVQWDGVNIISLVDHSEDVVRAAEQAALKVIRDKGLVDLRTPPSTRDTDDNDEPLSS